jgi:hypothetical protein
MKNFTRLKIESPLVNGQRAKLMFGPTIFGQRDEAIS